AAVHVGQSLQSEIAVDVATGRSKVLFDDSARVFSATDWLPDGSGLVGIESDQAWNFSRSQVALLSYPDAKVFPITRDTNSYSYVSVAASGRLLAAILSEARFNL